MSKITPMQQTKYYFEELEKEVGFLKDKSIVLHKTKSKSIYQSFGAKTKGIESDFIKIYRYVSNPNVSKKNEIFSIGFTFNYINKNPDEITIKVSFQKVLATNPYYFKLEDKDVILKERKEQTMFLLDFKNKFKDLLKEIKLLKTNEEQSKSKKQITNFFDLFNEIFIETFNLEDSTNKLNITINSLQNDKEIINIQQKINDSKKEIQILKEQFYNQKYVKKYQKDITNINKQIEELENSKKQKEKNYILKMENDLLNKTIEQKKEIINIQQNKFKSLFNKKTINCSDKTKKNIEEMLYENSSNNCF